MHVKFKELLELSSYLKNSTISVPEYLPIIPVTILWSLLTGGVIFGMDVVGNFIAMVNALGNAGFVGLLSVVFIMYFFLCDKCVK